MDVCYALDVTVGHWVAAGQRIAGVGSDGIFTGPHLHFTVRSGGISGASEAPVAWRRLRGVSLPG